LNGWTSQFPVLKTCAHYER